MLKGVSYKFKIKFPDALIPHISLQTCEKFLNNRFYSKTVTNHKQNTHKLHPYKTTVVHKLYTTGCKARWNFADWYVKWMHGG